MKSQDKTSHTSLLYATVTGAIGVVTSIPSEVFTILLKLQHNMSKLLPNVGLLNYEEYI